VEVQDVASGVKAVGTHLVDFRLDIVGCEADVVEADLVQVTDVRIGDRISLNLQGIVAEFDVLGLPERRGPATEAQSHYAETPESAERRARVKDQQRLANLSRPRPDTRPDKRDRRRIVKFQRGE